jgi:hypothetical protein
VNSHGHFSEFKTLEIFEFFKAVLNVIMPNVAVLSFMILSVSMPAHFVLKKRHGLKSKHSTLNLGIVLGSGGYETQ